MKSAVVTEEPCCPGALRNDLSAKSGSMAFIPQGGPPTMMPPNGEDVALFLHTSGTPLPRPHPAMQARMHCAAHANILLHFHVIRVWVMGCAGTTSKPKGVPLTHANLAASLANIRDTYELTPADRSLLVMPLFHVHGLMAGAAPLFKRLHPFHRCLAVPLSVDSSTSIIRPVLPCFHDSGACGIRLGAAKQSLQARRL